jgi:hypothetical protein
MLEFYNINFQMANWKLRNGSPQRKLKEWERALFPHLWCSIGIHKIKVKDFFFFYSTKVSSDFFKNLNFRKWKCGQQPVVEPNNGSVCAVAIMADSKHQDIIVKFVFGIWKLPSLTILSFNAYFNQQSIYHSNILIKCLIDFFSPLLSHTRTRTWELLISFCKMLDLCYLHLTKWTMLRFEKK